MEDIGGVGFYFMVRAASTDLPSSIQPEIQGMRHLYAVYDANTYVAKSEIAYTMVNGKFRFVRMRRTYAC